ncbi:3936_t:CDS:10 [Acaulospora colombiana]|uniref:3936_t:CDS:1 n=1 Tax=Acaulospora colombiana TaxID=27376 RepID=A0ACA9KR15_9GLOM|nr:3936_t:CDS:10 [Acaulospora colombiana]
MKFAKTLQSKVVLEWSTKYIDYKGLKGKLRTVERTKSTRENRLSSTTLRRSTDTIRSSNVSEHPKPQGLFSNSSQRAMSLTSIAESTSSLINKVSSMLTNWKKHSVDSTLPEHNPTPIVITSIETLMHQVNRYEREFFMMLKEELEKVDRFYESKEKESVESFEVIKRQYSRGRWAKQSTAADGPTISGSPDERQQKEVKHKKVKKLIEKALFEIYRGAELLRKYRVLNRIGFEKVLKKYEKITNVKVSKLYLSTIVNEKSFVKSSKLEKLIREVEDFYSVHFEEGSRKRSMRKLHVPNKKNVIPSLMFLALSLFMYLTIENTFGINPENYPRILAHANNCVKSRAIGIDKIINRLMGDSILEEKDLQDFSIGTFESEGDDDGYKDFETRNGSERYEYSEYEEYEDDNNDEEDSFSDEPKFKKYDFYTASYASRRLPIPMSIPSIIEVPENESSGLSSLSMDNG